MLAHRRRTGGEQPVHPVRHPVPRRTATGVVDPGELQPAREVLGAHPALGRAPQGSGAALDPHPLPRQLPPQHRGGRRRRFGEVAATRHPQHRSGPEAGVLRVGRQLGDPLDPDRQGRGERLERVVGAAPHEQHQGDGEERGAAGDEPERDEQQRRGGWDRWHGERCRGGRDDHRDRATVAHPPPTVAPPTVTRSRRASSFASPMPRTSIRSSTERNGP